MISHKNKWGYTSPGKRLLLALCALAAQGACFAQIPSLNDTPYIDIVYNGAESGSDYILSPVVTRGNIDNETNINTFRNFTLDGCTVECETSNLTIAGVDENGFTLFELTDASQDGTISIKATDNGLWTGYHYTTAYQLHHKQVYFEACLPNGDSDGYLGSSDWGDISVKGQINWTGATDHGDVVISAPTGSYTFSGYGEGSTSEDASTFNSDYPYYKANYTSTDFENSALTTGTPDIFYITISGLSEGQTIGLKNVTLRERVTAITQETPRFDVTLNYTDASTPAYTYELKDLDDRTLGFELDMTNDCVVTSSLTDGTATGVDEKGFVKLNADEADMTLTLKMTAPDGESSAFNWKTFFHAFHYEVSYDVYLLDTDGETCLKKEDWGDVEVDGQLSWRSTYDHNGGSAATGAKISSTNTSTHGTNTNTDYDEALIVAEHELEDGTVYYSVFYTGDLTDNWLEIWGFDQLPVKITGLSEGQAIALRNVTITCRLTNDDEYVNFFSGTGINSTNVKHKAAKWYGVRESTSENKYNDSFDEDNPMMTLADGTTEVQAAHEMVDTIYMLKGTSIDILIPQTYGSNQCSINNYFRWYNYLNDKNLYVGDSNTGLGSGGDIYDLITPVPYGSHDITAHRFANGYVTGDLNSTSASTQLGTDTYAYEHTLREISFYYPTDDEWTTGSLGSTLGQTDNSYYAIACDLSVYIDFSASTDYNPGTQDYKPFCSDNEWCEPTLAGRDVYYIIGIDPQSETSTAPSGLPDEFKQYWQLFDASYQGGGNGEGTHYLEEFEITMPSRHISTKTDEMVALTKDAQSYALPGETTPGALTVSFASGEDNGLTLYAVDESGYAISGITEISLSGTDRVIQFYKDTSKSYAWTVDDESTATILVTKTVDATTYNIARYKLTFKEEAIPLTEPQVHSLDDVPEESEWWWRDMYYRAPNYIDENYKLVTSLDFDYGDYGDGDLNTKTIYAPLSTSRWPGAVYNYPFPLKWDACSYSFYDGSYDTYPLAAGKALTEDPGGDGNYRVQTSWCMYDIVNWYVGYGEVYGLTPNSPQYPSVKNHEGSWLYVDASDRPGTVAELTFENDLCHGAQLAVTAWIKSDDSNTKQDDAAVMLTVTGVMVDDEGNETHTPIYRQYSGQIEATGTLSEDCESDQSITGKGSGTNEWFQTYFSFRVPDVAYDYYTVRVDNCCASTDGGDFYLDEVRVYCRNASVDVVQANSICGDSDGKSLVKVDVDYESIMQYLTDKDPADYLVSGDDLDGVTPETYSVDFVIVNRVVYEDYLASHITDGMSDAEILNVQKEAIDKAAVPIYYEYDSQEDSYGEGVTFMQLNFHDYYYENEKYDSESGEAQLPVKVTGEDALYYFRYYDYDEESEDPKLSCQLYVDFDTYTDYTIIIEGHADYSDGGWEETFIDLLTSPCAISTEFYIIPFSTIIKVDGEAVDPTVTACVGQASHIEPDIDYTLVAGDAEQITIEGGNIYFDWFFGTMEEYETAVTEGETELSSLEDALAHFRYIYKTATEPEWAEADADNDYTEADYKTLVYWYDAGKLLLYRRSVDLTMTEADAETAGGIRLVIKPLRTTVRANGEDITDLVCWNEVTLCILADGDSPVLSTGFSNITGYPEDYIPCLRIGANQAQQATEDSPLTVSLRGVDYDDVVNGSAVNGLREITSKEDMNKLFLVSTDDPDYSEPLKAEGFSKYSIPVGTVKSLTGTKKTETDAEAGSMEIYFNFSDACPSFKEGYSYSVSVYFEEDMEDEDAEANACLGTFPLEIKVVPEYLVWQGDATSNWNDDSMWKRATKAELNGLDGYEDYEDGYSNGFVPTGISHVVIPGGKAAELYMAGFSSAPGDDDTYEWVDEVEGYEPSKVADSPTENIQYDLVAVEDEDTGKLTTRHFRTAEAEQLHLEAGAMLLHPELLLYDKAWTDVRVAQDEWLLTATPLNGVVAGDWYTGTGGTEPTPYFTDITFDDSHSRLDPLVFQRGWGAQASMVYSAYDETQDADTVGLPAYASTAWTSVYNDASVAQQSGEGFSVEAELSSGGTYGTGTDSVTFRFPKADDSYTYQSVALSRTGAGKLLVSDLSDRSDEYGDADASSVYPSASSTVSVTLTPSPDGYCLVGNPFTAKMSLRKFFEVNGGDDGALKDEYWVETSMGPVAGEGSFTTLADDYYIEPYAAFFVEAKEVSGEVPESVSVSFTYDMQTLDAAPSSGVKAFFIKATGSLGQSGAAVQYSEEAQDSYSSGEDVVLMRSLTGHSRPVPMVYTEAGGKALSVNRLRSLSVIPLGVYASDEEEYTLTFQGVDYLSEPVLYDAQEDTKTPLEDGYELPLEGSSHGRYYILTTAIEEAESQQETDISVSSRRKGEVSVSSSEEIRRVEVFSVGGLLLGSLSLDEGRVACSLEGLPGGIAIVHVTTAEGMTSRKLVVK